VQTKETQAAKVILNISGRRAWFGSPAVTSHGWHCSSRSRRHLFDRIGRPNTEDVGIRLAGGREWCFASDRISNASCRRLGGPR